GDTNAYREFTTKLLSQQAGTTNQGIASAVVRVTLFRPDLLADVEPVFKLALVVPGTPGHLGDENVAKGMAAYRQRDFCGSLKWLEGWRRWAENNYGPASQAGYFCSMAHFKQGNLTAARADMADAGRRLDVLVRSGELGSDWSKYAESAVVR